MKLFEMTQGEFLVLRPAGQLTSATSAEFEKEVRSRIEAGNRRVVLDLADLDYISSAGLRVLLVLAKLLKRDDGTLSVCAMNETVTQVFEVTGLSSILATYQTLNEAIAAE